MGTRETGQGAIDMTLRLANASVMVILILDRSYQLRPQRKEVIP